MARGIVVKGLAFSGGAMVLVGVWLLASSRNPLIGAILMAVGATDLVLAIGLARRE